MARKADSRDTVLRLAKQLGVVRPRDALQRGIHPEYLRRLAVEGSLIRTGRGLYILANAPLSVHHSLAEACKRVPRGVVCLLSALRFHEIGTQNPAQVWLAIPRQDRVPRVGYPPLHVSRFSGPAMTEGIVEHHVDGVTVRVFSPAKTVVDCFRYRNRIGLDAALEALRDCRRLRKATSDDLWRYAAACRMTRVMKPYLEATV
ncbi:MAG: type IV toxin-antitoxin system AbiEi family antitoxin domain-containing protein [Planctomycetota bacterium]|nr:type IV toxin-antitoxin system AbiEi family antitoxin domain-containing protein [Planctomycetota bacterium]